MNQSYHSSFTRPIIRWGRLTNLVAIPLSFLPSVVLWLVYGVVPPIGDVLRGWGLIASIYAIYAVVEPVSYFPVVGLPGTYMCNLAGNTGNLRVPCSVIAQEVVGVEPATQKAELVSTLGIAGSVITNMIVVTLAAVGGASLMSIFPDVVLEAFQYVAPAVFGSVFAMYAAKNLGYGLFAFCLVMVLLTFFTLPTYLLIPLSVFATVAFAFWQHGRKKKGAAHV